MRFCSHTIWLVGGVLIGLAGCAGSRNVASIPDDSPPITTEMAAIPSSDVLLTAAFAESPSDNLPELPPAPDGEVVDIDIIAGETEPEPLRLNLPTALSMVGGDHPAVGFAQWRVQEAYATLDRAKVLWLPSIQPGFSFHKHDGNYQASNGAIVDVHRNSFQYGLGAGSTGAGTTPRPGVVAKFHLADAIFQPKISEENGMGTVARSQRCCELATVKSGDCLSRIAGCETGCADC